VIHHCRPLALALLIAAATSTAAAHAQERRWEVEAYGGAVVARTVSGGTETLPPAGAPIVTSNPLFPSREVASWFFGDGAALVNAVNGEFGGTSRIVALDSLFGSVESGRTGAFGARLRRSLSPTTSLELAVDILGRTAVAPADLATVVEGASRSFDETFTELLQVGPFTSLVVDAAGGVTGETARRELAATVALNADVGRVGPLTPFLTFGGGIVTVTGAMPVAELSGRYTFSVLGQVPIDESDRVRIQFERPLTFAGVAGAGLKHDVSERWMVRFDIRAFIGPDTTRVRVTADPVTQRGSPSGFVESFTNPSIQFSNDQSTGRRSSLGAPMLDRVSVFAGGVQTRTIVTLALTRRF
jgi:hypothetical protein